MMHEKRRWKPPVSARSPKLKSARGLRLVALAAVMAGLVAAAASPVQALSISTTITKNTAGTNTAAGNFSDFTETTGANADRQGLSTVSTLVAPGATVADSLGNNLTFSTRYAELLTADRSGNSNSSDSGVRTSDYRVQFTVTVASGVGYALKLDSRIFGALTLVDDSTGTGTTVTISNVTGKLNSVTEAGLGLTTGQTVTSGNTQILLTNSGTFSFTGTQTFNLDFSWTAQAFSQQDEGALRLGIPGTITGITADDYPGTGSRTADCTGGTMGAQGLCSGGANDGKSADGHFLTALVTITDELDVPMPASLLLVGGGAVVAGGTAWRRRRRDGR